MGLFGRKNEDKKCRAVAGRLYDGMSDKRATIYYGNAEAAYHHLKTLAAVFAANPVNAPEVIYPLCHEIYIDIWTRKHFGFSPAFMMNAYVLERIKEKYPHISAAQTEEVFARCVRYIYLHEPELQARDSQIEAFQENVRLNSEKNQPVELLHVQDSDYGLCAEKPQFVDGFGNDSAYLERLGTADGQPLTFERMGSLQVEGISGPVDIYAAFLHSGAHYGKLYLCNYGNSMPPRPPRGYAFLDEKGKHSAMGKTGEEFDRLLKETAAPPSDGNVQAAYARLTEKINGYKTVGYEPSRLLPLYRNLLVNLTAAYDADFESFIGKHLGISEITELCIDIRKHEKPQTIKAILDPCIRYVLAHESMYSGKEKCFMTVEETVAYLFESGMQEDSIPQLHDNITLLVLLYENVLHDVMCTANEKPDERRRRLISLFELTRRVSPTNAYIYARLSELYGAEQNDQRIESARQALYYAVPEENHYILQDAYDSLSLAYYATNLRLSAALSRLCVHYGKKDANSAFLLEDSDAPQLSLEESAAIVAQEGLQVGYSDLGKAVAGYMQQKASEPQQKPETQSRPTNPEEEKQILTLETGIRLYNQTQDREQRFELLSVMLGTLKTVPMYFQMEIDAAAFLGGKDPAELKAGDTITLQQDVGMKIKTLSENGNALIPAFTSEQHLSRAPSSSVINMYPAQYLPLVLGMNLPVVINGFSSREEVFVMTPEILKIVSDHLND